MADQLPLTTWILSAGALGTAAFGIVDGLKWFRPFGEAGFKHIDTMLGAGLHRALALAYGPEYGALLRAQYRNRDAREELVRSLRQGVRIGLTPETAAEMAADVGVVSAADLVAISEAITGAEEATSEEGSGHESEEEGHSALTDQQRGLLGRFELAVDARIDAALNLAESSYRSTARIWAGLISVVLALVAAFALAKLSPAGGAAEPVQWVMAILLGIVAVPLAPIAKDVASGLGAATRALRARR